MQKKFYLFIFTVHIWSSLSHFNTAIIRYLQTTSDGKEEKSIKEGGEASVLFEGNGNPSKHDGFGCFSNGGGGVGMEDGFVWFHHRQ